MPGLCHFLDFGDVLYTCFMSAPIMATKLYIPLPLPGIVPRRRLIERMNAGVGDGLQIDTHLRFGRLWQDHTGQRMDCGL